MRKVINRAKVDLTIFEAWTPGLAYLLGYTITDGCITTNNRYAVEWNLKDLEPLEMFKKMFNSEKKIEYTKRPHGDYYRFRLCGEAVAIKFMEFGILPRKSCSVVLPEIPNIVFFHFLRGVIDGDGSIVICKGGKLNKSNYKRLTTSIVSANKVFLEQIQAKVGIKSKIIKVIKQQFVLYRLTFDCSNAVKLLSKIYEHSENLRLERKFSKWQEFQATGQTYRMVA